jgi:purine catabolism regulator
LLTLSSLLAELDLRLAAGREAAERPIRWVHISELDDPTPWVSGGELLLTTGINLPRAAEQRAFVRLLAEHELAGLGFGTGFDHDRLPRALVAEAAELGFPVFEVPYEMPFIAITEKAFTRLVNEQYGVLERGIEVHARLERLVLAERGLGEILRAIAEAVRGSALLIDDRGEELARHPRERGIGAAAARSIRSQVAKRAAAGRRGPFVPEQGPLAGRAVAVPIPVGGSGAHRWLVAARSSGQVGDLERLLARQAAMVVGLELMRERVVRETERRLAGDVLAEALGGRLTPDELRTRLRPFGLSDSAAVLVFDTEDPDTAEPRLDAAVAAAGIPGLVAITTAAGRPLLCAVVDPGDSDPIEIAREAREALAGAGTRVRAAVSRTARIESLRRSFHEARCALEATSLANGSAPEVASHRDLGAFTLLLSLHDDDALRAYADSILSPIEDGEGEYGSELLRSLEAYIEQNGQWERAARELYCHRHTLRYRIRRVEELTGRDLSRAHDRIELWLALRARELVR